MRTKLVTCYSGFRFQCFLLEMHNWHPGTAYRTQFTHIGYSWHPNHDANPALWWSVKSKHWECNIHTSLCSIPKEAQSAIQLTANNKVYKPLCVRWWNICSVIHIWPICFHAFKQTNNWLAKWCQSLSSLLVKFNITFHNKVDFYGTRSKTSKSTSWL